MTAVIILKTHEVIDYSQSWSLYCLSYILDIIFDIFSCAIDIYKELCYICQQLMSRTNQPHHCHCSHSDSSYCHLSPVTAMAPSQASVLSSPPAVHRKTA